MIHPLLLLTATRGHVMQGEMWVIFGRNVFCVFISIITSYTITYNLGVMREMAFTPKLLLWRIIPLRITQSL